ncbi:MAG: response regulator [Planctomycetota bacterium]|jgi:DNA-binding NtrC family response regulator
MYLNGQTGEINVLASEGNWAWPEALRDIFRPRNVNLLVAGGAGDFVDIIRSRRIHTMIVDMDSRNGGLATVRIIRVSYPRLPCLLLATAAGETVLSKALEMDVFSVIDKPVDMRILQEQLHKLFIKRYNSYIFDRVES